MEFTKKMIPILCLLAIGIPAIAFHTGAEGVPDFESMEDVKQKKHAFFEYLYPMLEKANKEVLTKRKKLNHIMDDLDEGVELTQGEQKFLVTLSKEYSLQFDDLGIRENVEKLLRAVDYVPPSLALAHAANESGWGTSRFARKANNFFGQWCFRKGCGLVPKRRDAGSNHEVRKFSSTENSVRAYLKNINTGRAYSSLRIARAESRNNNDMLTGHELAGGLVKYSAGGEAHVEKIRSMIRTNKLVKYDERFWNETAIN